jgi:hypothetical protein
MVRLTWRSLVLVSKANRYVLYFNAHTVSSFPIHGLHSSPVNASFSRTSSVMSALLRPFSPVPLLMHASILILLQVYYASHVW